MAGIPQTNRAWLQGSSPSAAKGSTLAMTSPLLPDQMSWQVSRVKVGLEQRMSTPTNIPSGPGADGTGIAFQETVVMDSSFSEDSIDESGDIISTVEENITNKRSTQSAGHCSSPVQNTMRLANNRGRIYNSMHDTSIRFDKRDRSQKKQTDSDCLHGKFHDPQFGPQNDRNTMNTQKNREDLYSQSSMIIDQDDNSVGSFSGTSTPVRTWHDSHESREADRSNQLQTRRSEDSRISKARTTIEGGSSLGSTPTSIPSVLSVPELSQSKQSPLTNHLNRRCTPSIPGVRMTSSSNSHLRALQTNFVTQTEELVQVREHFSRTLERHAVPKSVSSSLHLPDAIFAEKSPEYSCDPILVDNRSSSCNAVSPGVGASVSYPDQDRPRKAVLTKAVDLEESNEHSDSIPRISADAVELVAAAADGEVASQERRHAEFLLLAENQKIRYRIESAMEILNEIRQAQADVAWLEINLPEQKWLQESDARSQDAELQPEAADFANKPQAAQISECNDAGRENGPLESHGSSNSEQLLQEKLKAATFELESLKHSMDMASREAMKERERILTDCDQVKSLLTHAVQSKSALEEQLQHVHNQHLVSLQELKAAHTVDVAKLQQTITEIYERCKSDAVVMAELNKKVANIENGHALYVADLKRNISLMNNDHKAALIELNLCMEHLQHCSQRDESTYYRHLGDIKLLHDEKTTKLERKMLEREKSFLQLDVTSKSAHLHLTEGISSLSCQLQDLHYHLGRLHLCHKEAFEITRSIEKEISSLTKLMALKHRYSVSKVEKKISNSAKSACLRLWIRKFRYLRKINLIYSKVQAKANATPSFQFLKRWKALTRQRTKICSFSKNMEWKRVSILVRLSWQKWISEASENMRLKNSCAAIVQRMRDRKLAHAIPKESNNHHDGQSPISTHGSLFPITGESQNLNAQWDPYEQGSSEYKNRYPHIKERGQQAIFSGSDLQSIMSKYSDFSPPGAMKNANSDYKHVQDLNSREFKAAEVGNYLQTGPYADGRAQSVLATSIMQSGVHGSSILPRNGSVLSDRARLLYPTSPPIEHFQSLSSKFELENIQPQTKVGSELHSKGLSYQYRSDFRPSFHSTDSVRKSPFSSLSARGRAILRKHAISSGQIYDLSPEVWALSHQTMQHRDSSPVFGFNKVFPSRLSTPS